MKATLLTLAAIAAAAAAVIGFHIAAGDPRTLEPATVPDEVEELATSWQEWHDEAARFASTGALDEGPCWCPDCIGPETDRA
ncbi:hypothetical protein C5B92_07125 [Rathayibacter sp. AY1A4]|uniref:hypothetical protein n=1 Tax=Rathayibacter sp. AY1A4 TaxID=2080522 RepID=UPI000CE776A4|nr:hypothetical protein [Rathayibacter sp. AY1A4]PPF18279.1 hypothetical protein C5B92_07125 [Rathayibacter sp. AY1A4]